VGNRRPHTEDEDESRSTIRLLQTGTVAESTPIRIWLSSIDDVRVDATTQETRGARTCYVPFRAEFPSPDRRRYSELSRSNLANNYKGLGDYRVAWWPGPVTCVTAFSVYNLRCPVQWPLNRTKYWTVDVRAGYCDTCYFTTSGSKGNESLF
jgi:hypothetical protein